MSDYSIEAYNPAWVVKFQSIKEMLTDVFGAQALAIEHVGSTSVPGMKAKSIIDVLVVVESIETLQDQREEMLSRGYVLQENYIAPNTLFFAGLMQRGISLRTFMFVSAVRPQKNNFL